MFEIKIDNKIIKIQLNKEENLTIIQGLQQLANNSIEIPRFCYHEELTIAGNCRMCLIEKEKTLKPIASCALNLVANDSFFTKSNFVKKVRENVLEFLLINHPLDCPICDQGGECDLQDQTLLFGNDRGRFFENKRAVLNKEAGPFIKTIMTRCIHCTRCVRFLNEISGFGSFGVIGRGSNMEIGSYIKNIQNLNELSSNIIDLCPVGALTSKINSFNSRPWEIYTLKSFNINDSLGGEYHFKIKNNKPYKIISLQKNNEFFSNYWLTDNIRFFFDAFNLQKIKKPFFFFNKLFISLSLKRIINLYTNICSLKFLNKTSINYNFFFNNTLSVDSLIFLKKINLVKKKTNFFFNTISLFKNLSVLTNQFLSINLDKILNLQQNYKILFFIGLNPRLEFPSLNLKLRKFYLQGLKKNYIKIFFFNTSLELNYDYINFGFNFKTLYNFFLGKNILNIFLIKKKHNLYFFYGQQFLLNQKIYTLFDKFLIYFTQKFNKFFLNIQKFIILKDLTLNSILYLNFKNFYSNFNLNLLLAKKNDIVNILINSSLPKIFNNKKLLNIFLGSNYIGFLNKNIINFILPIKNFTEYSSSFFNFTGQLKNYKIFIKNNTNNTLNQILNYLFYIKKEKKKYKEINLKFLSLVERNYIRATYRKTKIYKITKLKYLQKKYFKKYFNFIYKLSFIKYLNLNYLNLKYLNNNLNLNILNLNINFFFFNTFFLIDKYTIFSNNIFEDLSVNLQKIRNFNKICTNKNFNLIYIKKK